MTLPLQPFRPALAPLDERVLPAGGLPTPAHVVVVVLENHSFSQIRGNPDAPFLNALADGPDAALLTASFAFTHPSQPNYLALFSGSDQGVMDSAMPAAAPFQTPNLGAELRVAGRTFVGYSEDLPAEGSLVEAAGAYVRRHNPWSHWQGSGPNRLPPAVNQPFAAFPADFDRLPTVAFVVPNQLHNMHDGPVAAADAWVRDHLGGYTAWARTHDSLLVVTFDEDDASEGNRVFTVVAGQPVRAGPHAGRVDHFGLLRTIEDFYGLPHAGASAAATPMTGVWDTGASVAVGSAAGDVVRVFDAGGTERFTTAVFDEPAGGVRPAAADFTGDGVADLAVGTGPGRPTRVRVLDGEDRHELFALDPFEASFTGGVYVAAGDVTRDGVPDLVVTPDEGGGPRVRVFSGAGFGQVADFFGIDDPNFRGGCRAAVGDLDGDGVGDLVIAAGFGGGPRVAGFGGKTLASGTPVRSFPDFLAFEPELRGGTYVAAGDFDGDGKAEVVAGGGPGGGPRVIVFRGSDLLAGVRIRVSDFFAGDDGERGGARVAVKEFDGGAGAELVVGSGSGGLVTAYAGADLIGRSPSALFALDAFPGTFNGVFVG